MNNFNVVAPFYDRLAGLVFGATLRRAQAHYVSAIVPGARLLLLGGGTGGLLPEVLRQAQPAHLLYLEPAPAMLCRAVGRLLARPLPAHITFRQGTEARLRPDESFDVAVVPFVLDLFSDDTLRATFMPRLRATLAPGATLLVADFGPPATYWHRLLLWLMYRFFRLTAGIEARHLPDWPSRLTEAGFVPEETTTFRRGFVQASRWRLLA